MHKNKYRIKKNIYNNNDNNNNNIKKMELNKILWETVQVKSYKINRSYNNNKHWLVDWEITMLWTKVKDWVKNRAVKYGHVSNYVKIIVDDWKQLLNGIGNNVFKWKNENSQRILKKFRFWNLDDFWENILLTGTNYTYYYKDEQNKICFQNFGWDRATVIDWVTYLIDVEKENFMDNVYKIHAFDWITHKIYKNKVLIHEKEIFTNPTFKVWNWKPYIDDSILKIQDSINTSFTQISNTEKAVADPYIYISWAPVKDLSKYQFLSWEVQTFASSNVKIEKLSNSSVDSNFYTTIESHVKTIFELSKLSWYQSLKQASYTSVAEINSAMIKTNSFINTIKTNIKDDLNDWFYKILEILIWKTAAENFEFDFSLTELDLLKKNSEESIKLDLEIKQAETNWKKAAATVNLIKSGYTKEEAAELLNFKIKNK